MPRNSDAIADRGPAVGLRDRMGDSSGSRVRDTARYTRSGGGGFSRGGFVRDGGFGFRRGFDDCRPRVDDCRFGNNYIRPYCGRGYSSFGFGFGFLSGCGSYYGYPYAYPAYPIYEPYPVYGSPSYIAQPIYPPAGYVEQTPYEEFGPAAEAPTEPAPNAYAEQLPPADQQPAPPPGGGGKATAERMPSEQIQKLMTQGIESFKIGNYDEAARTFLQAAMADRNNVDGWLAYAVARFATGDFSMAATAIRRGVPLFPDVVNSTFDIRERYGDAKDFDRHLKALEAFVLEQQNDPDGWVVLGFVRHFSAQRELAARAFDVVKRHYEKDGELADTFLKAKPLSELKQQQTQPGGTAPEQTPDNPSRDRQGAVNPEPEQEGAVNPSRDRELAADPAERVDGDIAEIQVTPVAEQVISEP